VFCVRALMYRYSSGEGRGFEYRPFGLLLFSVTVMEFTEKTEQRVENCYRIAQLREVEVLSSADENSCDLCRWVGFVCGRMLRRKTRNVFHSDFHLVRCLLCNEPEVSFPRNGK